MVRRSRLIVLLIATVLLLSAPRARATMISITGIAGTSGTAGASGNPGADGTAGGDGQDVTAVADTPGENNTATATGGAGGTGGSGGAGVPAGADGGDGGAGGAGGDATARAIGSDATSVSATAVPGDVGPGGAGGSATSPGVVGQPGATGFPGASLAEANLETDVASQATASATAGRVDPFAAFAISQSRVGPATANAIVTNTGGGATSTAISGSDSVTGSGSGANAVARGTTDGPDAITVSATAQAAGRGDRTGTATAYGSNAGTGAVLVTAVAKNYAGNLAYDALGNLSATAEGYSSGGGDVVVEANVARYANSIEYTSSPDVVLNDAVRGSTSGHLTLRQTINDVTGFFAQGAANTSIRATNPGGGALSVDIFARGGRGAETVLGDILATSVTGADVDVDVTAISGLDSNGIFQENRNPGSPSTPSRIHAESNGGNVRTTVSFAVGNPLGFTDGVPLEMVDVATGDTTGALKLEQSARGGDGVPYSSRNVLLPPGSGGDAWSSLTKDTASSSLELRSWAKGGSSASATDSSDRRAGNAEAFVSGSNSAGLARVTARAEGGFGFYAPGGNAVIEATASTTGDGHEVVMGQEPTAFGIGVNNPIAWGGDVNCNGCDPGSAPKGGDASSRSTGSATGDSPVTVWDLAISGRSTTSRGIPVGPGGDASSTAIAQGGGISTVKARSDARGGLGLSGGNAEAVSSATGLGRVESWAHAAGSAGSGIAHASADGATGFARAEALTGTGTQPQLRAQSEALVGSRRDITATATHGASLVRANDPGLEGSVFFTDAPLADDVATVRAQNQSLEGEDVFALGGWQGTSDDDPLTLSTDLAIKMNTADSAKRLLIGAFGVSILGEGFESLSLSLTKNGSSQRSLLLATADDVIAFFAGTALDLGVGWNAGDEFVAHFDLLLGAGTRFEMGLGYATAVPEPGTGLLIAFGLVVLASRRQRARPTR
jgi:hypothetical protein